MQNNQLNNKYSNRGGLAAANLDTDSDLARDDTYNGYSTNKLGNNFAANQNRGGTGLFNNPNQNQLGNNTGLLGNNKNNLSINTGLGIQRQAGVFGQKQQNWAISPSNNIQNNFNSNQQVQGIVQKIAQKINSTNAFTNRLNNKPFNIADHMDSFNHYGTQVAEISKFTNFMLAYPINLNYNEIQILAGTFQVQTNSYYALGNMRKNNTDYISQLVDLVALQTSLNNVMYDGNQTGFNNAQQMGLAYARTQEKLSQLVHIFEEYIIKNQASIFQLFKAIDADGSNYIEYQELFNAVQQVAYGVFTINDIEEICGLMDSDRNGRISYPEFCRVLSQTASGSAIDDPAHWAYRIFEQIRRQLNREKASLAQIFNVNHMVREGEPILVPFGDFEQVLNKTFHLYLRQDQSRDLQELLDIQSQQGQVNLVDFLTLVGISDDLKTSSNEEWNTISKFVSQNKMNMKDYKDYQRDVKLIYKRLLFQRVDKNSLRLQFQEHVSDNTRGNDRFSTHNNRFSQNYNCIDSGVFTSIIQYNCNGQNNPFSPKHRVGVTNMNIENVARVFKDQSGQIDFEKFLELFSVFENWFKSYHFIMSTIHNKMQHDRISNVNVLLQNANIMDRITIEQFDRLLKSMYTPVENSELKQFVFFMGGDTESKVMQSNDFVDEFNIWLDEQDPTTGGNTGFVNISIDNVDPFMPTNVGHGKGAGNLVGQGMMTLTQDMTNALKSYLIELKEISSAIEKTNQSVTQFFSLFIDKGQRGGYNQNKMVDLQAWNSGIQRLNLRTDRWSQTPGRIFEAIVGRSQQIEVSQLQKFLAEARDESGANRNAKIESNFVMLIRQLNGDVEFVNNLFAKEDQYRSGKITMKIAVVRLEQAIGRTQLTSSEIEDTLTYYGEDKQGRGMLDYERFSRKFKRCSIDNSIPQGRFQARNDMGAGGQLTKDEETLQYIIRDIKDHFRGFNIKIADEADNMERAERKLNKFDRVQMNGSVKYLTFMQFLTKSGFNFKDRQYSDIFENHYRSTQFQYKDMIDLNAFQADLNKPEGAAFNLQFGHVGGHHDELEVDPNFKIDERIVKDVLLKMQNAFNHHRQQPQYAFEELERKENNDRNAQLVGYFRENQFFDFVGTELRIDLSKSEKMNLKAKFGGSSFKMKGSIDYQAIVKYLKSLEGGDLESIKKDDELYAFLQEVKSEEKRNKGNLMHSFQKQEAKMHSGYLPNYSFLLSEQDFYDVLQRDLAIRPKPNQRSAVQARYLDEAAQTTKKGNVSSAINYNRFMKDIEVVTFGYAETKKTVKLTKEQAAAYDRLLDFLENYKRINKFAYVLKEGDVLNVGMTHISSIDKAIQKIDYSVGRDEISKLKSPLHKSTKDEINIKEFYELLFTNDKKRASELAEKSLQQLDDTSKKTKIKEQAVFKLPRHTQNAHNTALDDIGRLLISRGGNYEEYLMEFIPVGSDKTNPMLKIVDLKKAFSQAKITLKDDSNEALRKFYASFQNSQNELPIIKLLAAFGLPPQTIGESTSVNKKLRMLQSDELKKAQTIVTHIKKKADQKLNGQTEEFIRELKKQDSQHVASYSFLSVCTRMLGDSFLNQIELKEYLDEVTLYLAEKSPEYISIQKLNYAFKRGPHDEPLKQHLVDGLVQTQAELMSSLKQSKGDKYMKDLALFMYDRNYKVDKFRSDKKQKDISIEAFRRELKKINYQASDDEIDTIITQMKNARSNLLNLTMLEKAIAEIVSKKQINLNSTQNVKDAIDRFPLNVQKCLQDIEMMLKQKNMTVDEFFKYLDKNGNDHVDRKEFIDGIEIMKGNYRNIDKTNLGAVFDKLDHNKDGDLTKNEFASFIKGLDLASVQKLEQLPKSIRDDMQKQIGDLFALMDEDKSNTLDVDEIYQSYQNLGMPRTKQECKDLISHQTNGQSDVLSFQQFSDMMQKIMFEQMSANISKEQDLRRIFHEADTDYSGYLDIHELYEAIHKMGAKVDEAEVVKLMMEIDDNQNMKIDIDEFVNFFTVGDQMDFQDNNNRETFMKIQMARRLSLADFAKAFNKLPSNFIQSFTTEAWNENRNLPSSVFKAQIDPRTMLWKDIYEMRDFDQKNLNITSPDQKPYTRPILTNIGAMIKLNEATGVVLPQDKQKNALEQQVKMRAIRVSLTYKPHNKRELIGNAIQIPCHFDIKDSDIWYIADSNPASHMANVMFRAVERDIEQLRATEASLIFELVVIMQEGYGAKTTEMCCGWCELPIDSLQRGGSQSLKIQGGSPMALTEINTKDIKKERSGLRYFTSIFTGTDQALSITVTPYSSLREDQKYHLNLMPSTCLLHSELLTMISGFINYKAKTLLAEKGVQQFFRKPPGDVILSNFPKMLDCPDICETMSKIWSEDINPKMTGSNAKNIKYAITNMEDFVTRLYPILYSVEFRDQMNSQGVTSTARANPEDYKQRVKLIKAALRHGQTSAKEKEADPPSAMTTFTPFSINEFEYEVWDTSKARQDNFLNRVRL